MCNDHLVHLDKKQFMLLYFCNYMGSNTIWNHRTSSIVFYQGGPIDHCTHVIVTVAQSSSESYYNVEWTSIMAIAHFRMLNNDLMEKDPYMVP